MGLFNKTVVGRAIGRRGGPSWKSRLDKKLKKVEEENAEYFRVQRQLEDPEQKADVMARFKSRSRQLNPNAGRTSTVLSSANRAGMPPKMGPANTMSQSQIERADPLASAEAEELRKKKLALVKGKGFMGKVQKAYIEKSLL